MTICSLTDVTYCLIIAPPLAFEVPIFDNPESLIKKHPPKRLQKLGEVDGPEDISNLTHKELDERQKEAERRRRAILNQRVMSAKTRPRPKPVSHSDAMNHDVSR